MKLTPTTVPIAFVAVAAAALVLVSQAGLASREAAPQATKVATVDLSAVVAGLKQRAEAEIGLQRMQQEVQQEQESRQAEMTRLQEELKDLPPGDERQARLEELELARLNFQAWVRFTNEKVDVEISLLLQDLYRTIRSAVHDLAEAEGYDLILMDDSEGELTVNSDSPLTREAQIRQQMSGRSILYTGPSIDLTEDLIERMNNLYHAGQGGG